MGDSFADVFELRERLISDYSSYIRSFIRIRDERVDALVTSCLDQGRLWPDPLIQLNPSFQYAGTVDDLVSEGLLYSECSRVFRAGKDRGEGKALRLYQYQTDAIRRARAGRSYVLTTGTGSGKSLAYIIPIVDHVLRNGSGRGIQAIVVYPMNALANSQAGELQKFLQLGYADGKGPVTFARYTGQERDEERNAIVARPPDVLLTNYVMLELILTRVYEKQLVKAAQGLRFLVLDELHTYRGRQGADVALVVRRSREFFGAKQLQVVGPSATLAGPGTYDQQQAEVGEVASVLFGAEVTPPSDVVGETLQHAAPEEDSLDPKFLAALKAPVEDPNSTSPTTYRAFSNQTVHRLLDRKAIRETLLDFHRSSVSIAPAATPRSEHLIELRRLCGSKLEQDWLGFLEDNDYHLPSVAQQFLQVCQTRPDFFYEQHNAAIYVDGPPHEYAERKLRDAAQTECMDDRGYVVIRFSNKDDWATVLKKYQNIFGSGK
jgi:hypothetical protein